MACQDLMPFLVQICSVHCCSVSAKLPRWGWIHWRQNDGRREKRMERKMRKAVEESLLQMVHWVWPPWWSGSCFIGSVSPAPTVIRINLTVMLKGSIWLEMEAINDRAPAGQPQSLHTSASALSRFSTILVVLVFPWKTQLGYPNNHLSYVELFLWTVLRLNLPRTRLAQCTQKFESRESCSLWGREVAYDTNRQSGNTFWCR